MYNLATRLPTDSPLHILIVDDDPGEIKALGRLLRVAGHTVVTAFNGAEALLHFQKQRFDLVIADYQMPEMNGDELAAAITRFFPDQPIMIRTAHVERLRSLNGVLPNAVMVIDKLARAAELFEAIAKLSKKY